MSLDQGATHLKMWGSSRPESSMHKLIVQNSWLCVHPLSWTAQHLQLMRCEFHDIDVPPEAETETETTPPDADAVRYAERVATDLTSGFRYIAASQLLCHLGSPLERVTGHPTFFFARRRVHVPQCQIFCPTTTATPPLANNSASLLTVGYSYSDIAIMEREERFQAALNSFARPSIPIYRILQKRLAKCNPEVWNRDPYLVCVMLSLAQYRSDDLYPSQPANYHVRLLVSKKGDTTHAHAFDAKFSMGVLDELDDPSHHKKATWPMIYHTTVPYEPYDSFANRITSHLLRDEHSFSIKEAGTGSQCIPKKRKLS